MIPTDRSGLTFVERVLAGLTCLSLGVMVVSSIVLVFRLIGAYVSPELFAIGIAVGAYVGLRAGIVAARRGYW